MTTNNAKPSKGGGTSSGKSIPVLEAEVQSHEQSQARVEHDLLLKKGEHDSTKQKLEALKADIDAQSKKIAANEQIIATAPDAHEATRLRKKADLELDELKKEMFFVERQAQDLQNKWYTVQSEHAMKENVLRNKKFTLDHMNPDSNQGGFQSAQAEIRMLESDLSRSQAAFQQAQEDAKRFDSRVYDLQMQMKQLTQKQRKAEQEETAAHRLEIYIAENQRLQIELAAKATEEKQLEEDLKKIVRTVKKLEEQLTRERVDLDEAKRALARERA